MNLDLIACSDALDYLKTLPDNSVHCCVTSPPYFGLRNYGVDDQIGLEQTPQEYIANLVAVFREVRRVLRKDGTCWIVMGDSYAGNRSYQVPDSKWTDVGNLKASKVPQGLKNKDLMMIPARLAIALCDDGWYLRQEIVWSKNNPMPESVTDRVTRSHEWIYALEHGLEDDEEVGIAYTVSKHSKYVVDMAVIREDNTPDMQRRAAAGHTRGGTMESWDESRNDRDNLAANREITANGRNARSVWTVPSSQSNYDYCKTCKSLFVGKERSQIAKKKIGVKTIKTCPNCGDTDSWIAHYAAFPAALVERMLLAGCPARVCDKCGAPWKRQYRKTGHVDAREEAHAPNSGPTKVDSTGWQPQSLPIGNDLRPQYRRALELFQEKGLTNKHLEAIRAVGLADTGRAQATMDGAGNNADEMQRLAEEAKEALGGYYREFTFTAKEDLGLAPTCKCGSENFETGIVLDPFMGSGTTALVAQKLGRHYVGCDLSRDYVNLATARLLHALYPPAVVKDDGVQLGLFNKGAS